jgi:hypothetical protein
MGDHGRVEGWTEVREQAESIQRVPPQEEEVAVEGMAQGNFSDFTLLSLTLHKIRWTE